MSTEKMEFLKNEMVPMFKKLTPDMKPKWGVMNAQQMVEHFSETLRYANGKTKLPLHTPEEHLQKLRIFMLSEGPFRENTKNPMIGEDPGKEKHPSFEAALTELETEVNDFFAVFSADETLVTQNPIFGELTYVQNIHLVHKHALHHLKQFGIVEL